MYYFFFAHKTIFVNFEMANVWLGMYLCGNFDSRNVLINLSTNHVEIFLPICQPDFFLYFYWLDFSLTCLAKR